ncbi:Calmodulin-binding transcription activator [Quillaja saponaria]|uniref:Calmodulin-binding transcription activator n=1 Tax=Quillaja saponaria TaxID=32244 RepID=A0AAD7QF45_QUISA|nr:Calmodulin-binding transcription activator [Quillaja saponaria]
MNLDGYNWKEKKDGIICSLKVVYEEYACGQDNPSFVCRCYWLLDKSLEHIVLVHYRETQEFQDSPVKPVDSNPAPWMLSEQFDYGAGNAYSGGGKEFLEPNENLAVRNQKGMLHEINTLEWDWDELLVNDPNNPGNIPGFDQHNQIAVNDTMSNDTTNPSKEIPYSDDLTEPVAGSNDAPGDQVTSCLQKRYHISGVALDSLDTMDIDGLQSQKTQNSFGRSMNHIMADSPGSIHAAESLISSGLESNCSLGVAHHQISLPEQVFTVFDVSLAWAFSTELTKIIVIGSFHNYYRHLANSKLSCVCGDVCVTAETVQVGAYRCLVSRHFPGLVNLYMSLDGHKPISQVLNFEFRTPILFDPLTSSEEKSKWAVFQLQMRLASLIFDTSKCFNILSNEVLPNKRWAKHFFFKTSNIFNSWEHWIKLTEDNKAPFPQAKDILLVLTLKSRMKGWLLERILSGVKNTEYDVKGLGVIHLCSILGYTWAVSLYSLSGMSLDDPDKLGRTALHWAAYCGQMDMIAALLSAGANPILVTDPTSKYPGGRTAGDLASIHGYGGLAAYLSEKYLVVHSKHMSLAGNISGPLKTGTTDTVNSENLTEDHLTLEDIILAAYRRAAEAAACIQATFKKSDTEGRLL